MIPESKVRVPFEPAEDPLSALAGRGTEERRVIELKAFPKIDPEGQIHFGMCCVEGDVLETVQRLPRDSRVSKHRPILLRPTVGTDLRPFGHGLRCVVLRRILGRRD